LSNQKKEINSIEQKIISLLEEAPKNSREMENKLNFSSEEIIFALQNLLESNKIAINKSNQYFIK
jgi:ATP-dependent DNA helicase RecQ